MLDLVCLWFREKEVVLCKKCVFIHLSCNLDKFLHKNVILFFPGKRIQHVQKVQFENKELIFLNYFTDLYSHREKIAKIPPHTI